LHTTAEEIGEVAMFKQVSRRRFLGAAGFGVAAAIAEPSTAAASLHEHKPNVGLKPEQALRLLLAGNRRWVTGGANHPHQSVARREALSHVQHPFATIVSCIDSRVPPELVFDRGIGDLAVIRTGAQVLDDGVVLGSVEFAADHLHTPLILIMGHQRCGAVKAAIEVIESGGTAPGHIQSVVDALRPAYAVAVREPGDLLDNMVRAQTRLAVERIRTDPLIQEFVADGRVRVHGAYYSLDSGAASIIA
jgi:carbonic anhydrase